MAKKIPSLIWYSGGGVLFLVVAGVLILWLAGYFHPKINAATPTHTPSAQRHPGDRPIVAAKLIDRPVIETAVGTIGAVHETTIAAKILARVIAVNVIAGQEVTQGDVLVKLDDADLKARLEQAEAAVQSATAARDQAQIEFERIEKLYHANNAAKIEWERAQTEVKTAVSELQRAEQSRQELVTVLEYATIRSPMDGVIVDKLVEVGDIASPGEPLLKMYDASRMQLVASVRESLTQRLRVGEPIQVRIDALHKTCTGQVREIVPEAESASRAFSVKVTGPCPPGLYSGMFGRLLIPMDPEQILVVPATAIEHVGQLSFVDVVDQTKEPAVLERRSVQLGRQLDDDQVEILSGLKPGESVALQLARGA